MKILSINFIAYGCFRDKELNLSGGKEGLHIIYGLNEAGKSVALRGIRALFYGIMERTSDNFLVKNEDLRIGATVSDSTYPFFKFIRKKGRVNTLLDPDGTLLDEQILNNILVNMPQDQFFRLFTINHNELIEGGKEIIEGKGDVGKSIFSAGMSGVSLHNILKRLDEEAEALYLPRGKRAINENISKFKELQKKIKEKSLHRSSFEELDKEYKDTQHKRAELASSLEQMRTELIRLERLKQAIPYAGKLRELRQKISDMGDVLILPEDFSKKRIKTAEELERAQTEIKDAENKILKYQTELFSIIIPVDLISQEKLITTYHTQLGSHFKALQDLPKLKGQADQIRRDAFEILSELQPGMSINEVETIRLSTEEIHIIRSLAGRHQALINKQESLNDKLQTLHKKKRKITSGLNELGNPCETRTLKNLIKRIHKAGDLELNLSNSLKEKILIEKKLEVLLKKLPWSGSTEEIESLPVPFFETIDRFEKEFETINNDIKNISARHEEIEQKLMTIIKEIESIKKAGSLPAKQDLLNARIHRDKGWKLIKQAWLEKIRDEKAIAEYSGELKLEETYEKSIQTADQISDRLRDEADKVALVDQKELDLKQSKSTLAELNKELRKKKEIQEKLQKDWNNLWADLNIVPLTPREMRSWVNKQQEVSSLIERMRNAKFIAETIETNIKEFRRELIHVVKELTGKQYSDSTPFDEILNDAEELLENFEREANTRKNLTDSLIEIEAEIKDAKEEMMVLEKERKSWDIHWSTAVAHINKKETMSPSVANEVIDKIQILFNRLNEEAKLKHRIDSILCDSRDFSDRVHELTDRVAPDLSALPAEEIAAILNDRLRKAKEDKVRSDMLKNQIEEEQKRKETANQTLQRMTEKLKSMCSIAKCIDPSQLDEIEIRSQEASYMNNEIRQTENILCDYSGGGTVDEILKEVQSLQADSLPSQIEELKNRIKEKESEVDVIMQKIGAFQNELNKMDGTSEAAEASEEAQSVLAKINTEMDRYIQVRLASLILQNEIDRYRKNNQDSILKRAGEIFAKLTLNVFSDLSSDFNEYDKPVLVGIRASGSHVCIDGMSDGTVDQLYLAIRLSIFEKYIESQKPMPFIIDDVLVNFDDKRAQSALKVFAEVSKKAQVIFFTHHEHLLNLARQVLDEDVLYIHYI